MSSGFYREALAHGRVWTLRDVAFSPVPVWSSEVLARRTSAAYDGGDVVAVDLEVWRDEALAGPELLLALNPTGPEVPGVAAAQVEAGLRAREGC